MHVVPGPNAIEATRLALLGRLQAFDLSERCVYRLETVLEEWLSNVLRHGAASEAPVDIELGIDAHELHLCFSDEGPAFDPVAAPRPEPYIDLAQARVGGLGLEMMRRATQSLRYERLGGRNQLWVTLARR